MNLFSREINFHKNLIVLTFTSKYSKNQPRFLLISSLTNPPFSNIARFDIRDVYFAACKTRRQIFKVLPTFQCGQHNLECLIIFLTHCSEAGNTSLLMGAFNGQETFRRPHTLQTTTKENPKGKGIFN